MSLPITDSPNALGSAISSGTSESGLRTAGPSPNARGSRATLRPRPASTSTVPARTPTSSPQECQTGPERQPRPSTVTTRRLSARHLTQRTASKGSRSSESVAARSPESASGVGRPPRAREGEIGRSQPARSRALSSPSEPTLGTGRLRRMNPTAFSTDPFSLPEHGSRQRLPIL